MIRSRVDLPVPLGPTTPILAPCRNDNVTLSRTTLSPCVLRTLRRVKTYSAMIRDPTAQRLGSTDRGVPSCGVRGALGLWLGGSRQLATVELARAAVEV